MSECIGLAGHCDWLIAFEGRGLAGQLYLLSRVILWPIAVLNYFVFLLSCIFSGTLVLTVPLSL